MKVKFIGFEWLLGRGISILDLLQDMAQRPVNADSESFILLDVQSEWSIGAVIRVLDQRRWTQILRVSGKLRITAEELAHNANIAHVNFFVINTLTGRGLYEAYHGGTSLNLFCHQVKEHYKDLKKRRIQGAVKTYLEEGRPGEVAERAARKDFANSFRYALLERQGAFLNRVASLSALKSLSFESVDYAPDEQAYRPLAKHASRISHRFSYGPEGVSPNKVIKALGAAISSLGARGAKVAGIDPSNNEVVYKYMHDVEPFAEHDYDDLVIDVNFSSEMPVSELRKTAVMKELLATALQPEILARLTS